MKVWDHRALRLGKAPTLIRVLVTAVVGCIGLSAAGQSSGAVDKLSEVKSPDPWTQAPDGFRGVKFGATVEEAQVVLGPMKCDDGRDWIPRVQSCHTTDRSKAFRVANEVINTYYFFDEGKFVGVTFSEGMMAGLTQFPPPTYVELSTAFKQKFGTPTYSRTFRAHGIREERGNMFNGGRDKHIPYDYTFETISWENETVSAFLVSDGRYRLSNGAIEVQSWIKKKTDAEKARKTSVTPF
jgi:hypothetical protein